LRQILRAGAQLLPLARVQLVNMKRSPLTAAAAILLGAVAAPAFADAAITELGATSTPLSAPSCPKGVTPANCTIILTRVTALETIGDGVVYPTTVKQAGQLVAFTVGLSSLSSSRTTRKSDVHYLDSQYGGTTQIAISVLRPTGAKQLRKWAVVAFSPTFHVQPYLGYVVQFPLTSTITVKPGDVVALTTPTWAPVLSINLQAKKFAYRQSRMSSCTNPPATSQAQLTIGVSASYMCNYTGTRVEYTATEVTTPPYPANYVRSVRVIRR
jgi:hypothetical protein